MSWHAWSLIPVQPAVTASLSVPGPRWVLGTKPPTTVFCPGSRHGVLGSVALHCKTEVPGNLCLPLGGLEQVRKMGN